MMSAVKKEVVCVHCLWGHARLKEEGTRLYYHTFKESNGQGYDTYTVPCTTQSKSGLETYRKYAVGIIAPRVAEAEQKLRKLKASLRVVKEAEEILKIHAEVERS
jgi:hypothetical protein